MPIPTHISDHEFVPLMSDVPSSLVFLGGKEYPLDGEAVRGDIKEWLTTLEGKLPREWPQIDEFSQPLDGFNYWTDCVYLGLLLCRTDPLPAFHFAAPQVSTVFPPVMCMYVLLGSFPILMH
ncbi:hypothetical protein ACFX10_031715 [Malus domestica]